MHLQKYGIPIVQVQVGGFIHQWHPDNEEWKNKETKPTIENKKVIQERKELQLMSRLRT